MCHFRTSSQLLLAAMSLLLSSNASAESYAFAVSWQPEFCETKGTKPECVAMKPTRFDARNFTLHGLWPQTSEYCGATEQQKKADSDGKWQQLPAVTLKPDVQAALTEAMPGTASYLERHEWLRHGSCANLGADEYFTTAIGLLRQLNGSEFGRFVSKRVGSDISLERMRQIADASFGVTAKDSIEYLCEARKNTSQALVEIRVHLAASDLLSLDLASSLGRPIRRAKDADLCVGGPVYIDVVVEN